MRCIPCARASCCCFEAFGTHTRTHADRSPCLHTCVKMMLNLIVALVFVSAVSVSTAAEVGDAVWGSLFFLAPMILCMILCMHARGQLISCMP